MKFNLITFNCRFSHSCLALFYVRNELAKNLPDSLVSINQFTINDPYYETVLRVTESGAEALFFSVYIWNAAYIGRLIVDLNRITPQAALVVGGPQAPALQAELPFPVTVVHGEIEGIDQSFYRDIESNTLKNNYHAANVKHFDFPYKQDDFDSQLKNRNIYYESTRGCPFSCSYCLSSISRGITTKGTGEVVEELKKILDQQPKIIRFVDRTFNADPQRTVEIWRFLAEYDRKITENYKKTKNLTTFHFEIAPDLFTDEMFSFLEKVRTGLFQFEIGIQSTNEQTLSAVNRKMDRVKATENIKKLIAINTTHLHIDLILGLPFDDKESFASSFKDIFLIQPHYIQMGLLKLLPETAIRRKMVDYGMTACAQPPYQVMSTAWLNHEEMSALYWFGEGVEAFYNNRFFKTFFSYINKHYDPFLFFEKIISFCFKNNFFCLAKTQKLMVEILFQTIKELNDYELLLEYLVYDWLLCGHRFLPDIIYRNLNEQRDFLWRKMPEKLPGLYDIKNRNSFFKGNIFCDFSGKFIKNIGMSGVDERGFIAFLKEEDSGVIKRCKTIFLEF